MMSVMHKHVVVVLQDHDAKKIKKLLLILRCIILFIWFWIKSLQHINFLHLFKQLGKTLKIKVKVEIILVKDTELLRMYSKYLSGEAITGLNP